MMCSVPKSPENYRLRERLDAACVTESVCLTTFPLLHWVQTVNPQRLFKAPLCMGWIGFPPHDSGTPNSTCNDSLFILSPYLTCTWYVSYWTAFATALATLPATVWSSAVNSSASHLPPHVPPALQNTFSMPPLPTKSSTPEKPNSVQPWNKRVNNTP